MNSLKNKTLSVILSFAALLAALPVGDAQAAIAELGFESEVVAGGFTLPTSMAFAPDGRIFIAEKGGTVRVVRDGILLSEPVITLTDINSFGDRGLIGIATDPNFAGNGYLYLAYTYENSPGSNISGIKTGRIVRVTVLGDTASEASKVVLVGTVGGNAALPSCDDYPSGTDCIPSDAISHTVGGLRFGPDGKLYATTGDGANFDFADPKSLRAQNLNSLAGKVLRVNSDGTAPSDNPFYNGNPSANRSKVYAYGVRNAFRLNFDQRDGALYAGDVGWGGWEEVDRIVRGGNYGWPCYEGSEATTHNCVASGMTLPTYVYPHNSTGAGSITVGSFPSNNAYPANYNSSMWIGDYAQNWLKRVVIDENYNVVSVHDFDDSPNGPVDISTGPDGNIYYIAIYTGDLVRITHTDGNRRPVVFASANPVSGLAPLSVNFTSAGTNDPDGDAITYLWNFGDGADSMLANPSHTYTANGTYTASLTVTDSHGSSAAKSVTVTVGNQAPSASITSPASGSLYSVGQTINVVGTGTDPESGTLPPSAFSWQIILHHNIHTHTLQTTSGTTAISFEGPDHSASDVYIEVILTVTDSAGLTGTESINMYLNNGAGSGNLISNPSVETEDPANANMPHKWLTGWFGVLDPIFTYPVAGLEGARAMKVELASYQSGNAKWYFDPVFVTPGAKYNFSSHYVSNVETAQFAQFGLSNGTFQYQLLGNLAPAAASTLVNHEITIPAGVQTLSVFHEITSVGSLTTDDFSLTLATSTPPPPPPAPTNLVANPNLEIADASGNGPSNWVANTWGNHTAVHTYPVVGYNGQSAARTEITSYPANGSGDAKWSFEKVAITPGTEYTYSDHYRSNTISDIIGQYTLTDGSFHYFGLAKEIQPTTSWQSITRTFTPPSNATHVTFLHLISAVGYIEVDDVDLHASGTSTPSETNVPIVEFTNPLEGQTVSGTVGATASSTDDTAVTYIFYAVDGVPATGQITTPPYAWNWDTTTVANGSHALKATTHDPSGNNSTHTITVTVNNTAPPPPTSGNLILNPSLETPGTGGDPANWFRGGWGANDRAYTYPTLGTDGARAGKVEITSYGSGDAKWFFEDVAVTGGNTYAFTHAYKSNVSTELLARYQTASGTQYAFLAALPASPSFSTSTRQITVPANATALTVFHLLHSVGTLEVDAFSLTSDTPPPPPPPGSDTFDRGKVTLSFDDGWVTHSTKALPILNAANQKGTFYIVSQETAEAAPVELIQNPSLETVGASGDPANWLRGGWGTNTAVFTYPVPGTDGANAAKIEVTSYTDGDAKWYFQDVNIIPNQLYTIKDSYNSTASSQAVIRYALQGGGFQYAFLGVLPSTSGAWVDFSREITTPANAVSMTLFHVLASTGTLTVDNYSLKRVQIYVDPAEMLAMQSAGHEIGAHTKTHPDLATITPAEQQNEIAGSRTDLLGMGATPVETFAYPLGSYNDGIKTITQNAGFAAARGVDRGYNVKTTDKYALKIQQVGRTVTFAEIEAWISQAAQDKTWLILMFHQIDDDSAHTFGTTEAILQQTVNYAGTANVDVITVREGVALMNP